MISSTRTKKILLVLALLATGVVGWVVYDNRERPLGEGFEYLGKEDYGCWISICASGPGSTYMYGTNVSVDKLYEKFPSMKFQGTENMVSSGSDESMLQTYTKNNTSITIEVYPRNPTFSRHLPEAENYRNVIGVDSRDYTLIKSSTSK